MRRDKSKVAPTLSASSFYSSNNAAAKDTAAPSRPKRKAAEAAAGELNESAKKMRPSSGSTTRASSGSAARTSSASSSATPARQRGRPRKQPQPAQSEDDEQSIDDADDDEGEADQEADTPAAESSPPAKRPAKRTSKRQASAAIKATKQAAAKPRLSAALSEQGEQEDEFTSSSGPSENEDEADQDFGGSARKTRASKVAGVSKSVKGAAKAKKTGAKMATGAAGPAKAQTAARSRARAGAAGGAGRQGSGVKAVKGSKEKLPIKDDNFIFNAVKDPDSTLDSIAEDWVAMYHDAPGRALAHMVTFLLRCAACNGDVDEEAATDLDGVVDQVEKLQNEAKKESMPSYPIISKAADFRRFRQSLSELLSQVLASAHESEALFDDTLFDTLKTWIIALSSSSLRAFRHTATQFSLFLVSALNHVLAQLRSAREAAIRQRDAELKKGRNDKARLRGMEKRVQEQKDFEAIVKAHKGDLFNSVFVHRYRDADLNIRCDCVAELGVWMKSYPEQYLSGTYFTYLGWVLSDAEPAVRLSAIQAMHGLYGKGVISGPLRHFTNRFKGRLIDMAVGETDGSARCATFNVLAAIDRQVADQEEENEVLDETQRNLLGIQLFDVEPKIRRACAPYVSSMLENLVQADVASHARADDDHEMDGEDGEDGAASTESKLRFRSLAVLLVKFGKVLDERITNAEQDWSTFSEDDAIMQSGIDKEASRPTRFGIAVQALWELNDGLHDIRPLIELLSFDHSYGEDADMDESNDDVDALPPAPAHLKLTTEEETALIEVLPTLLRKIRDDAEGGGEVEEEALVKASRLCIESVPRFFAKCKTDAARIAEVLVLPQIIKLDEYIELGGMTSYAALWDDISDQFVRHTEPALLEAAAASMRSLSRAMGFGETNAAKLAALQDTILSSLRAAAENTDIERGSLTDEQIHLFAALMLRLRVLATSFDNTQLIEADDGGKVSSGWELTLALASRGRAGTERPDEDTMVQNALTCLGWYLAWKAHQLRAAVVSGHMQQTTLDTYLTNRRVIVGLMSDLVGASAVAGIAAGTQRVAFQQLVRLHIVFVPRKAAYTDDEEQIAKTQLASTLELECNSDLQKRCAKFVESEVWRFGFSLNQEKDAQRTKRAGTVDGSSERGAGADSSSIAPLSSDVEDNDDVSNQGKRGQKKDTDGTTTPFRPSKALLKRELEFGSVIASFVSALRLGIFDVKHAGILLKQFGRLGAMFDACLKVLVEVLREAALQYGFASEVCGMALTAMEAAFEFFLAEGKKGSDANFLALCRAISSTLVMRGRNLTILRAVPSSSLVQLHVGGLKYALQKAKDGAEQGIEVASKRAPGYFRGLLYLMASMQARDALAIKTEMDKLIRNAEIDTSFKAWDPQRTYEKRLVGIIAKNKEAKTAGSGHPASAQRQAASEAADNEQAAPSSDAPSRAGQTVDGEHDADGDHDNDADEMRDVEADLAAPTAVAAAAAGPSKAAGSSRPQARPFSKGSKNTIATSYLNDDEDDDDIYDGPKSPSANRTSSARRSPPSSLHILVDDEVVGESSPRVRPAQVRGGEDEESGDESSSSVADKENRGPAGTRQRTRRT